MTNKEIAKAFQLLGLLMELHDENPFKIRSYQNAYRNLRMLDRPLSEMTDEEIGALKGVGKAISGKIRELLDTGRMQTLDKYLANTPEGVREMLQIKGFGPKKIRVIWKDLGAENIGELLYAVNENRLIELKGFGEKTQQDLKEKLLYYQKSKHRFHYASLEAEAYQLLEQLSEHFPGARLSLTGAIRRRCNTLDGIDILMAYDGDLSGGVANAHLQVLQEENGLLTGRSANDLPVRLHSCSIHEFGSKLFRYTAAPPFMKAFLENFPGLDFRELREEQDIFEKAGLPFIEPELREQDRAIGLAKEGKLPVLIEDQDIRGVLHAHSHYSDGLNSLEDMARYAKEEGYSYLGITDHSKSAFYANGLPPERVREQFEEVDRLNSQLAPFRIFKGIESDILGDGSLDYDEDLLREFDFIIASVHSNLRMDEEKATRRLITAIENPYTSILGHPTGRLLLSRKGYPLDHRRVIDACAEHHVAIEINANPYRLDLDWTWIPYALEKGVTLAVNPDAHSLEGIHDIHYGVCSARKGGLEAAQCLNCLEVNAFSRWCRAR
jgi:DNA polymerase (family 10)